MARNWNNQEKFNNKKKRTPRVTISRTEMQAFPVAVTSPTPYWNDLYSGEGVIFQASPRITHPGKGTELY